MVDASQNLGGRVPLFDPQALTEAQKAVYNTINTKMVPWAESAGFEAKTKDGRLIGPFNTVLFSPKIAEAFLALQGAEGEHTTLNNRTRQVVILTVGAVWNSDYERYAHTAVARKAGLSETAIQALAHGKQSAELSSTEALAQRVTQHLMLEHQLGEELYREAESAFGATGLVDLMILAGCYVTVCSLLNAFQVPVPQSR